MEKKKKKLEDLKKTVKLKMPKEGLDSTLQEMVLVLMHHQQALLELLVDRGIFTYKEFEERVDLEISRSIKL